MHTQKKQEYSNPLVPEKKYDAELQEIKTFPRKNKDVYGAILNFNIEHNGKSLKIPFFAPAKLSVSRGDENPSRLADHLRNLDLLEPVVKELGVEEEVMSGKHKAVVTSEQDEEEFKTVLNAFLKGKTFVVDVTTHQNGDESIVDSLVETKEEL